MLEMFKSEARKLRELKEEAERLETSNATLEKEKSELLDERNRLKQEVVDLELNKKTTNEDIKHMIKKTEEMQDIEKTKFELKCEKEKNDAIAEVKDTYRDKVEDGLKTERDNIKQMYSEILSRLPNVDISVDR